MFGLLNDAKKVLQSALELYLEIIYPLPKHPIGIEMVDTKTNRCLE